MELVFKKQGFIIYKLIPCLIITMFAFMCLYGSKVYADNSVYDDFTTYNASNGETLEFYYNITNLPIIDGYYPLISSSFDSGTNQYLFEAYYFSVSDINNSIVYGLPHPSIDNAILVRMNSCDYYKLVKRQSVSSSNLSNITVDFSNPTYPLQTKHNKSSEYGITTLYPNNSYTFFDLKDSQGNVVFQAPSQTRTIVASQVGEVEMNKILQEILGILPVVIVVLVGLIAIRKGIIFLMARMKKA